MLTIKTREESESKVKMSDDAAVFAVVRTALSEIKEGSYATLVLRKNVNSDRFLCPIRLRHPRNTDGENIMVRYKDREKKMIVPPDTPVVTFVPSDKSELKTGAHIISFGASQKGNVLEANRDNVGRDGIFPPI
jgi:hypothetical protein